MKKMMKLSSVVIGIDYSMQSPAMTIHTGDSWSVKNCEFFYLTKTRKYLLSKKPFFGGSSSPIDFISNEERFDYLGSWFRDRIPMGEYQIFIEGYSYGSKGNTFEIGENTGVLKNKLFKESKKPIIQLSPSSVKKIATGKGNKVDKKDMCLAFIEETGIKIDEFFGIGLGISPIADIVDSYYVAKAGFDHLYNPQSKIIISG